MKRRIICLLLAVMMIFSTAVTAFAEETGGESAGGNTTVETPDTSDPGTNDPGSGRQGPQVLHAQR